MNGTRITKTLLSLLLTSALALQAQANELAIDVQGGNTLNFNDSYDVVSEDNISPFGSYSVGYEIVDNLFLYGEYTMGGEFDDLFFAFDMDFTMYSALVAAQYRYPLTSWFRPMIRIGVGPYWGDIDVMVVDEEFDDTQVGFVAYALAGFDITIPFGDPDNPVDFWDRFALGLSNGYGYEFRTALNFDDVTLLPPDEEFADDRDIEIDNLAFDLGTLDLNGFTWRFGIAVRIEL